MADWHDSLPLGKHSDYVSRYEPGLLCGVARSLPRGALGAQVEFHGVDVWTAHELSWLQPGGKPVVAVGEFVVPCHSPQLIESKSLKLYLNSLNLTEFESWEAVRACLADDLSRVAGAPVAVRLKTIQQVAEEGIQAPSAEDLDVCTLTGCASAPAPGLLVVDPRRIERVRLRSDLLRSLCPVTGQPDWGSVLFEYEGPAIDRSGLLSYIVSFREHAEFHEQCVERMFVDITRRCSPVSLSVYARYLRRGGLDINPFRSSVAGLTPPVIRLSRQ